MTNQPTPISMRDAGAILGVDRTQALRLFNQGRLGEKVGTQDTSNGGALRAAVLVDRAAVVAYGLQVGRCDSEGNPLAADRGTRASAPFRDPKTARTALRLGHIATLFDVAKTTVNSWRAGAARALPPADAHDVNGYPGYFLETLLEFARAEGLDTPGRHLVDKLLRSRPDTGG